MAGQHRWAVRLATGTGLLGLTVTSGLTILANHIVNEFSSPHQLLDESAFTWEVPRAYTKPPATAQRPLLFKTVDGILLRGDFWAQPRKAPTIVLCHGYRISRSHLNSVAAVEYACGYNVLLFDFRGHGASESVMTSGGNAEVHDLQAAIVAAARQKETLPGRIIIHGFSMGASVALLTPPHPDVVAIIADSPYARLDDILHRMVCYQLTQASAGWRFQIRQLRYLLPAIAWAILAMSVIVFRIRFGYGFEARTDMSFRRWKAKRRRRTQSTLSQHTIPILLIHATGDNLIPFAHARQIEAEARAYDVPLETYFVDGNTHCGAYGYDPQAYGRAVQRFLARHLGDDLPEQHRPMR
jgi:alpha-beta hydrolase superfamily lysophospholipase